MTHRPGAALRRRAAARRGGAGAGADPLVVLADEPSGNLDHGNSERLHELFAHLSREFETALVVVTHNRALAARADRVLSLEGGRLVPLVRRGVHALMSCDQCREREAVIHLTQIVNEQVTTLHLCERCAGGEGGGEPGARAEDAAGHFPRRHGGGAPEQAPAPRTATPAPAAAGRCRISGRAAGWAAPSATGPSRCRCATCCGGCTARPTTWASATPSGGPRRANERPRAAADLREQLRLAVETENFELAAELRDRLRVME